MKRENKPPEMDADQDGPGCVKPAARIGRLFGPLLTLGAFVVFMVGFILTVFTPVPGGAFVFALGLTLLICTSEWFARRLGQLRLRFARVDNGMLWLEQRMGDRIGEALRRTRPPGGE